LPSFRTCKQSPSIEAHRYERVLLERTYRQLVGTRPEEVPVRKMGSDSARVHNNLLSVLRVARRNVAQDDAAGCNRKGTASREGENKGQC